MRKSMLLTAIIAVLVACSSDTTTAPPIDNTPHAGYFVAVNGSQTGDGSAANPWSLATALAQPSIVQPGDTIWLHGGTYAGNFVSMLTGTAAAPVILRQFPGERATIDGRLDINGRYAYYWGFEVTDSDPLRVTATAGSRPADLPRNMVTVFVTGPFNKLINLVIHDLGDGMFAGSPADGLEVYGSLFYNNGWIGPDRGHGHNLYLQNQVTTKRIVDNILFNSFSTGLKIGGDQAYLINFLIQGNTGFFAGAPALGSFDWQLNTQAEGGLQIGNITYDHNSFYHSDGNKGSVGIGFIGDPPANFPLTITNNIVQGGVEANRQIATFTGNKVASGPTPYTVAGQRMILVRIPTGVPLSSYHFDNNAYSYVPAPVGPLFLNENGVGTTFTTIPTWQGATGWDSHSSLTSSAFPGMDIIVRPNFYEAGRANITVWNWTNGSSADVDVSGVLKIGDKYTIHHVYDFYGPPILTGTYSGGPISLPMREYPSPTPIGMTVQPPSTGSSFNVFILQKS